jgi:hypothetical protein
VIGATEEVTTAYMFICFRHLKKSWKGCVTIQTGLYDLTGRQTGLFSEGDVYLFARFSDSSPRFRGNKDDKDVLINLLMFTDLDLVMGGGVLAHLARIVYVLY